MLVAIAIVAIALSKMEREREMVRMTDEVVRKAMHGRGVSRDAAHAFLVGDLNLLPGPRGRPILRFPLDSEYPCLPPSL